MNISKHFTHSLCIMHCALCIAITSLTSAAFAADVSDVIVRQQWPWSTDIKVEFKLTNVTGPVTVNVEAFDGATPLDSSTLKAAITGDLYGIDQGGVFSFMIDPTKAFGNTRVAIPDFRVKLSVTDQPNANDIIYKIVDLVSPHAVTDVTRKDLMNGKWGKIATSFSEIDPAWTTSLDDVLIWLDVTNEVYKTDKIAFRRIPAAGKSFQFQKGIEAATNAYYSAGEGIKVSFTKDYYMSVFELTQRQFRNVTTSFGAQYFYNTNEVYRWTRPADQSYQWYRYQDRPSASGSTKGAATYALKNSNALKNRSDYSVVLPTEAQWEFACRAGTDTFKYSGETGTLLNYTYHQDFPSKAMRAYKINGSGGNYGSSSTNDGSGRNDDISYQTLTVGSLKPNAWGLYDMLGNLREWCSDYMVDTANLWKCACYAEEDNVDPAGPTSEEAGGTTLRAIRGGYYSLNPPSYGSMGREQQHRHYNDIWNGIRLCIVINEGGAL